MAEIKLFVCCHKPFEVPKHPLLVPIQVGATLADRHFEGFLHDDAGENISAKNRSYCELTAQYWAWKNMDADYYGFFHYRRYLYPDSAAKLPYRLEGEPGLALLDTLDFDRLGELVPNYDLVVPKGENMYVPVRGHYAAAPHHHKKDMEIIERILRERHPEMVEAAERYLSGTVCYFGNIYIMSKAVFHDYCSWLFPILEEFDRQTDFSGYTPQELRVDGYLAERLLGIWYEFQKDTLRALELPRVHFIKEQDQLKTKSVLHAVAPPGTQRRAMLKRMKNAVVSRGGSV